MSMRHGFWHWYWGCWLGIALYFTAWSVLLFQEPLLPTLLTMLIQKGTLGCLSLAVIKMALRHPLEGLHWRQWRTWGAQAGFCLLISTFGLTLNACFRPLVAWLFGSPFLFAQIVEIIPYVYSGNFHWIFLLELSITGGTHLISMQKRLLDQTARTARLETNLLQAQRAALRMQLQPHFIFNTLNSLSTLVHTSSEDADRMIARLGSFLRLTLDRAPQDLQSLKCELEFIEAYLAIEGIRFGERLQFQVDVPPELMEQQLPSFILQPVVENALKHGLADRCEGGCVSIRTRLTSDGKLHIQVQDNGSGFQQGREGTGISNIRSRLKLLYDASASFSIRQPPEGGTQVDIRLPALEPAL